MNRFLVRLLVLLTVLLGVNYLAWRWLESLNWSAWWIAVPLVLAETYSLINVTLFGLTVWRIRHRTAAGDPPPGATVDVFVTTHGQPVDLVMTTARAAHDIDHPHRTWILDDGARPELARLAADHGVGYLPRGDDRTGMPGHAGAGTLGDALTAAQGEFLLVLEAGQVPDPQILTRTLGWFDDPQVALVQTPWHSVDVPGDDPLGHQERLFYGPVLQGMDGWNAAFYCGSNAVLRREALMQLGLSGHAREVARDVRRTLARTRAALRRARRSPEAAHPVVAGMLDDVEAATERARADLKDGTPLTELTSRLEREVDAAARRTVTQDFDQIQLDLAVIAALDLPPENSMVWPEELAAAVDRMSRHDLSPLASIPPVRQVLDAAATGRPDQAQPVVPRPAASATEDMATSMCLHALGWRSVYHHEVLAHGPAPEDPGTVLTQRLRRAQGTARAGLRESPLLKRGLSPGQRLMYFTTMWSRFSGFAAVVYVAAPVVYLMSGILPVDSLGPELFSRLLPFMVVTQLLLLAAGRDVRAWRGQQYGMALFPTWIRAWVMAAGSVWTGRALGSAPTPRVHRDRGSGWRLVRPQLVAMGLLSAALVIGTARWITGLNEPVGTFVNVAWAVFDLTVLSVLVTAVRRGHRTPQNRTTDALHH